MKRKKHEFDEHDDAGTDDLSANGLEQQATDTDPGPTDGDAAAELAQAEAKIQDLSEKYQRALAEMENARKRHQREMADYRVTAVSSFARELLGVLDNLDRAITGLPDDQMDDPVVMGVRMVSEQFQQVLANHGVSRIDAHGQEFDPNQHEAVGHDETAQVPPGTVTEELVKGYRLGDRLLRASVVKIAKAPSE